MGEPELAVSVMAGAQDLRLVVGLILALDGDRRRAAHQRRAEAADEPCRDQALGPGALAHEEPAGGDLADRRRRMGRRRAGGKPGLVACAAGCAAVDDDRLRGARELEREAAGMGLGRIRDRRRRADVGDQHGLAGLEPLVAGMRRAPHRPAAGALIGQEGRELIGGAAAHAVEAGDAAVAEPQETQQRQHAVDGAGERLRRLEAARRIALAQRQKIEQQLDRDLRVPAAMAAVGKDLPIELARQDGGRAPEPRFEPLAAEPDIAERDRGGEPMQRLAREAHVAIELARRLVDGAQEAAIEVVVGTFEEQRRLGEEGHGAAGEHRRRPGDAPAGGAAVEELGDEGAAVRPGERRLGGAQVAQPAEAVERLGPGAARRIAGEGRAPAGRDRPAGEDETAGIDVARDGRIARAQILRRDQDALCRRGEEARRNRNRSERRTSRLPQGEAVESRTVRPPLHARSFSAARGAARIAMGVVG